MANACLRVKDTFAVWPETKSESRNMEKQQRLIGNIISETDKDVTPLPWARGDRRSQWIEKRAAQTAPQQAEN